jgi:hypothetical protein
MSKILCFLAFILWLIITLILVLTIFGIILMLGYDDDEWFGIAQDLVKGIKGLD